MYYIIKRGERFCTIYYRTIIGQPNKQPGRTVPPTNWHTTRSSYTDGVLTDRHTHIHIHNLNIHDILIHWKSHRVKRGAVGVGNNKTLAHSRACARASIHSTCAIQPSNRRHRQMTWHTYLCMHSQHTYTHTPPHNSAPPQFLYISIISEHTHANTHIYTRTKRHTSKHIVVGRNEEDKEKSTTTIAHIKHSHISYPKPQNLQYNISTEPYIVYHICKYDENSTQTETKYYIIYNYIYVYVYYLWIFKSIKWYIKGIKLDLNNSHNTHTKPSICSIITQNRILHACKM